MFNKLLTGALLSLLLTGEALAAPTSTSAKPLLNWNQGTNQTFEGWQWYDDLAYGLPGWLMTEQGQHGGVQDFSWGKGPRLFKSSGYGEQSTAKIDTTVRAPSTSSGGSLWAYETPESNHHVTSWWIWYDGMPLSERGVTDNDTDRMSFYLKTEGMTPIKEDGSNTSVPNNFHIGTYLCWNTSGPVYGQGDGCPYEGPGNQHYYHYLAINPGAWIHVLLDQHPQHLRNSGPVKNNPTLSSFGKNYFAQLHQFYMEIRYGQSQHTDFHLDELEYYSTKDSVEPNQNDDSITSLWVGYWPATDSWEMGFQDGSFPKLTEGTQSTFEIRWSTTPITNANFANATPISPMFYGGVAHTGPGGENLVRRVDEWTGNVWTRFKIPDSVESASSVIYFAVKDVSVAGAHVGTKWPWNKTGGDGHNAPTSYIKTIDYHLSPESGYSPPGPMKF